MCEAYLSSVPPLVHASEACAANHGRREREKKLGDDAYEEVDFNSMFPRELEVRLESQLLEG